LLILTVIKQPANEESKQFNKPTRLQANQKYIHQPTRLQANQKYIPQANAFAASQNCFIQLYQVPFCFI
jgi:hypothetical protein